MRAAIRSFKVGAAARPLTARTITVTGVPAPWQSADIGSPSAPGATQYSNGTFTVDARVRSQLALSWGVETFIVPSVSHTDDMVRQVDFSLLSIGRLREGA